MLSQCGEEECTNHECCPKCNKVKKWRGATAPDYVYTFLCDERSPSITYKPIVADKTSGTKSIATKASGTTVDRIVLYFKERFRMGKHV